MSNNEIEINIEEIMSKIRREIAEKGYSDDILSFQDISVENGTSQPYSKSDYQYLLGELNFKNRIEWYRNLNGSFIKRLIKKVIRKPITFLMLPIVEEQNYFNAVVTREFNQLTGYMERQEVVIDKYKEDIRHLQDKVEKLEKQLQDK